MRGLLPGFLRRRQEPPPFASRPAHEQVELIVELEKKYREGESIRERCMQAEDWDAAARMTSKLTALASIIEELRAEAAA